MSSNETNFNRRRIRASYITSVVSIAMVLFMLGLLGLLLVDAKTVKELPQASKRHLAQQLVADIAARLGQPS